MQRKKSSPYSSSRAFFEESLLEEASKIVDAGQVEITLYDEGSKEVHGNVKDGSFSHACRLDFDARGLLCSARCSCKGSFASPCLHLASLFLELEKETGGCSLGGKEGYALFLKALLSRGFSPLPYLKRAIKEYKARKEKEGFEGKEAIECLKLAFTSYTGYSGFGDARIGYLMLPLLEELGFGEEEKSLLVDEIPSCLSSEARKSFFISAFTSPVFSKASLERFEAGLTNGRSYDLLRLFDKDEAKLLALLPPFTLHLLCGADFRFHGFLALSEELLSRGDKDGISLISKNPNCLLSSEQWQKLGRSLEKDGDVSLALSCFKRCFGVGGGDFPTLCSYYRELSEEEKKEKQGELLASLSSSKMLLPFSFLLGKGKQSDISSFLLSDFPCLKEELSSYSYQSILSSKLVSSLKKEVLSKDEEKAVWDCFASFPFLSVYLSQEEAKRLSLRSLSSRSSYLSLLDKYSLLESEGLRRRGR